MFKSTVKILALLVGLLLVLILAMGGYLLVNKQKIKQLALNEVNKHLDAKMEVNNIDIALLQQFPKVSLDLHIVRIADPLQPKGYFFQAEHVFVGFNFWDIINHQYQIKLIKVDSAVVNILINQKGVGNYHIIKTNNNQHADSSLLLSLEKILVSGARVTYNNLQNKQTASFNLSQTQISGRFVGNNDLLSCKGNFYVNYVKNSGSTIFSNKRINLNTTLNINQSTGGYQIAEGYVEMDDLRLQLSGTAKSTAGNTAININFDAKNIQVANLMSIIPNMADKTKQYQTTGNAYVKGSVVGNYNAKEFPTVQLNFGVSNGSITDNKNLNINNISLEGSFDNLVNGNNVGNVVLNKLAFTTNEGTIIGNAQIKNFKNPYLSASLKGETGIGDLLKLIPQETITSANGKLLFNMQFSGLIKDLQNKKLDAITSTGNMEIDANSIVLANAKSIIKNIQAKGEVNKTDADFKQISIDYDNTKVELNMKLKNIVPYILLNNQHLLIDMVAKANVIDVAWYSLLFNSPANTKAKNNTSNIAITAKVAIDKLIYNQFLATNVTANFSYDNDVFTATKVSLNTMKGNITSDVQLTFADNKTLATATTAIKSIDINELFKVCDNFAQAEITDKHIKGLASGNIDLVGVWDDKLNCQTDKLHLLCEVNITNGELINYTPLMALAKYIDVNDLKHIKFAELKNTIQIKNEQIIIPECEIKNSALNLVVSGTHSFNNIIDYKVAVKINEVLNKKRKQKPNEFNEEPTTDGGMKLYLTMKGPINNYAITYDKLSAKKQVKQDFKQEKKNIKELLKQELNINTKDKIKEKEKDDDELEFEPE